MITEVCSNKAYHTTFPTESSIHFKGSSFGIAFKLFGTLFWKFSIAAEFIFKICGLFLSDYCQSLN